MCNQAFTCGSAYDTYSDTYITLHVHVWLFYIYMRDCERTAGFLENLQKTADYGYVLKGFRNYWYWNFCWTFSQPLFATQNDRYRVLLSWEINIQIITDAEPQGNYVDD